MENSLRLSQINLLVTRDKMKSYKWTYLIVSYQTFKRSKRRKRSMESRDLNIEMHIWAYQHTKYIINWILKVIYMKNCSTSIWSSAQKFTFRADGHTNWRTDGQTSGRKFWNLAYSFNYVITKDVKICTYCWYVRCVTIIVRVGGNTLAPNRHNPLSCTDGPPDKGSTIKKSVVC